MKTYSLALQDKDGHWTTNWYENLNLNDFDWEKVEAYAIKHGCIAYGYYYGNDSRKLTSSRCRTVLKTFENHE